MRYKKIKKIKKYFHVLYEVPKNMKVEEETVFYQTNIIDF